LYKKITTLFLYLAMFELITFILLQLASLNGSTTNDVGNSGWGGDKKAATSTTSDVGNSGWGGDKKAAASTTSDVGNSGWGGDIISRP
jgi:hypothetical protein